MRQIAILIMTILLATTCHAQEEGVSYQPMSTTPPKAAVKSTVTEIHGRKLIDDYHWFRDKEQREVLAYLRAENTYCNSIMKDSEQTQSLLFEEMKSRIRETDMSVPQRIGNFNYYSRTEEGKQYRIYCRRGIEAGTPEQVIFDANEYAKELPYFSIGTLRVSPDHNILAYSIDSSGGEKFELAFINLVTGITYPDRIPSTTYSLQWAEDNKTVFYTLMDDSGRANRIMRHILGTDPANDSLVYEEEDGQFWTGISKTRDRKYLIISSSSSTTCETRILEATNPLGDFRIFAERQQGIEYGIEHQNGIFYILTNENAINFKVMKTQDNKIDKAHWTEFIAHSDNVLIDDIDAFANYIAIAERQNGLQQIRLYNAKTKQFSNIAFDEATYSLDIDSNPEYDTDLLRFDYSSLTTPESIYDYNMATGEKELKKQYEVLGIFKRENYMAERIFATAKDGTLVPISLVYHKNTRSEDMAAPLYLTGYGAYGSSYDPMFSHSCLSLLDRGFIFAIAHIRGGQEMGRKWYDDGKLLNKKNTFTDFIACAEHLINQRYTSPQQLVISGGSAGGLLMGAVTNMRPALFRVVIADVPFVDIINTMLDPSLPLVREEYEEWGNPQLKEYFDYMYSYSPYDNIKAQGYPHMLVTSGLNDPRVMYWEPTKYVAKLRKMKTDANMLLLKTNMDSGHAGASGRYDYLKEIAFEYAFIFKALAISF